MRRELMLSLVAAAGILALSACHPYHHSVSVSTGGDDVAVLGDGDKVLTVAATLDCPQTQGGLERVSAASDGKSCTYKRGDDEDIVLSLVDLKGQSPREALTPLETDLAAQVSVHPDAPGPVSVDTSHGDGDDKAKIDLPGLHIDAHGDKAKVSVLGVTVNADGDHADVKAGHGGDNATVHAGPGGAEVRTGSIGAHSANLVYILAGDTAGPNGYRADGYIAKGPVAGPLVVGEFKSKNKDGDHHDHDLESLIDLNAKAG